MKAGISVWIIISRSLHKSGDLVDLIDVIDHPSTEELSSHRIQSALQANPEYRCSRTCVFRRSQKSSLLFWILNSFWMIQDPVSHRESWTLWVVNPLWITHQLLRLITGRKSPHHTLYPLRENWNIQWLNSRLIQIAFLWHNPVCVTINPCTA